MKKGTLKSLPVWAQETIADLKACLKTQALENGELFARARDAEERGRKADIEAATAIKQKEALEKRATTAEADLQSCKLELATLRGYAQRINQTDNAHHHRPAPQPTVPGAVPPEPPPPPFMLPVVGTFTGSNEDPSNINAYMRNRW